MADVHRLPLRGHDLPETWRAPSRAKVYRVDLGWAWSHRCSAQNLDFSDWSLGSQPAAFAVAWAHVKQCKG